MTRIGFFALLVGCAAHAEPAVVEIAPLPTVAPSAPSAPPAVVIQDPVEVEDQRDPRRVHQLRSQALVTVETHQLEQLLAATAQSSPERPTLLRRIADDYVELRKLHAPGAHEKAIGYYKRLVDEHPNYPSMDDVLYYLALEYEIGHDVAQARRTQYELIKNHPTSPWIPYSYFAFGEMFLAEATNDPTKLELAKQSYREAMKLSSPIATKATCRLAEVMSLEHDDAGAAALRSKAGCLP